MSGRMLGTKVDGVVPDFAAVRLCDGLVGDVGVWSERGRVDWVLEFWVGRDEVCAQAYIYRIGKMEGGACA